MSDRRRADRNGEKGIRLSDYLASIALPVGIIAFGVALSAGSDQVRAFIDLCRAALP